MNKRGGGGEEEEAEGLERQRPKRLLCLILLHKIKLKLYSNKASWWNGTCDTKCPKVAAHHDRCVPIRGPPLSEDKVHAAAEGHLLHVDCKGSTKMRWSWTFSLFPFCHLATKLQLDTSRKYHAPWFFIMCSVSCSFELRPNLKVLALDISANVGWRRIDPLEALLLWDERTHLFGVFGRAFEMGKPSHAAVMQSTFKCCL